jgi:hypothetical protein
MEPTRCPMCGAASWAEEPWRPSDAFVRDLDPASLPMQRELDAVAILPGVPLS